MNNNKYPKCKEWINSVFNPLGVYKIEMLTNLKQNFDSETFSGIYLGGGDTVKLMKEINDSHFNEYLFNSLSRGIPVYGGSAGAIILGKDIRTAPEAKGIDEKFSDGIDVLFGYSVFPHFNSKENINQIYEKNKLPLILLPENSGAYIQGNILTVYGFESIIIIDKNQKQHILKPNCSFKLL